MDAPLLNVRNLHISFGRGSDAREIVHDLSFSVSAGEILALVGESGCGKSVTALSLLHLLPRQGRVTGGQILFDGRDLVPLTEAQIDGVRGAEIAMVFQDVMYSLNPVLTIGKQMCEGMIRHLHLSRADAEKEALRLLERTGIPGAASVLRKYPHMLSGGMRQRVMIAMALSCHPRLLIADEPTTALDVTIQLQIMQLLRELREETGMAILLITHDLGVVAEIADRVAVLYAGECLETADVRTLLNHPAHAYTRALMQAVPGLHDPRDRVLYSIPGSVPERYDLLPGCRFQDRCRFQATCRIKDHPEMQPQETPEHLSRCNPPEEAPV